MMVFPFASLLLVLGSTGTAFPEPAEWQVLTSRLPYRWDENRWIGEPTEEPQLPLVRDRPNLQTCIGLAQWPGAIARASDSGAPIRAALHLLGANTNARLPFTEEDWAKKSHLPVSPQTKDILDMLQRFRRTGTQVQEITPESRTNWERLPDALKTVIWRVFLSEIVAESSVDRMLPANDRTRYGQGRGTWRENWADVAQGRRPESMEAAKKLDRQALAEACLDLQGGISMALRDWDSWTSSNTVSNLRFPPIQIRTDLGPIWITDSARNKIPLGAALVFDLGGDDEYATPDPQQPSAAPLVQLIIDLSGDDHYRDEIGGYLACGIGGVSVVIDRDGMDEFRTVGMGIGCGMLGAGWVINLAGDDVFSAEGPYAMGAAANGVGAFFDFGGDNRFASQVQALGFGGPHGVGVFLSGGGNDVYEMKGPYCLGANFGGSGIGVACDGGGDDRYHTGASSLGSGDTGGFGMFWDEFGTDSYQIGERCLGAGIRGGFGLAGDGSGNDVYTSVDGLGYAKSGTGVFLDFEGDDHYDSAYGLGYSAQSGTSFCWDRSGQDTYTLKRDFPGFAAASSNTLFPLSQSDAVALFLDSAGRDDYDREELKDGKSWSAGGAGSFGYDNAK